MSGLNFPPKRAALAILLAATALAACAPSDDRQPAPGASAGQAQETGPYAAAEKAMSNAMMAAAARHLRPLLARRRPAPR